MYTDFPWKEGHAEHIARVQVDSPDAVQVIQWEVGCSVSPAD